MEIIKVCFSFEAISKKSLFTLYKSFAIVIQIGTLSKHNDYFNVCTHTKKKHVRNKYPSNEFYFELKWNHSEFGLFPRKMPVLIEHQFNVISVNFRWNEYALFQLKLPIGKHKLNTKLPNQMNWISRCFNFVRWKQNGKFAVSLHRYGNKTQHVCNKTNKQRNRTDA